MPDSHSAARGPEAFVPGSIAYYPLPGAEVLQWNKVNWTVDPQDTVLLIHDAQNHWVQMFADPTPWLNNLIRLRQACEAAGVPCIFTAARPSRNRAERGLAASMWGMGVGGLAAQGGAAGVVSALTPQATDFVVDKPKYSAFFDTQLEALMHRLGRRQMLITGVFGHHGVMLTAADAYMRNIQALLVTDAIADYSEQEHLMTLKYVAEVCGCLVPTETAVRAVQQPVVAQSAV